MLWCSIKAVLVWLAIMLVGTTLLGFIVRGVIEGAPRPSGSEDLQDSALQGEYQKLRAINVVVTLVAVGATAAGFWALYRYLGGPLTVVAAAMVMASRLPDLLVEIKAGKPISRETMHRGPLDYLGAALTWGALPVVWFALCGSVPAT